MKQDKGEGGDRSETEDGHVPRSAAFGIGVGAAAAMSLLLLALRFTFDAQIVTEAMADWLTRLLPPPIFDFFLERLQFGAKPLLFALILLGQIGVGGGIGLLCRRFIPGLGSEGARLLFSLALAIALWLILGLVLTPIMGGGPFGTSLPTASWGYAASLFAGTATYAILLVQGYQLLAARNDPGPDQGRRKVLRLAVLAGIVVIGGGFVLRTILDNLDTLTPRRAPRPTGTLPPEVTSNEEFYVVAKSPVTPQVNADDWRLEVDGGGNPYSLTYAELRELPSIEEYVTLTCISNPVGGDLISNALWKGVPLRLLLERAQLPHGAERIAFHAADGYVDSFPLEVAMRDNVIVAHEMNGVALPPEHGFPARIIVPGLYGMENVKWLTKIEPVPATFRGYWQQRGWADTAIIKTMSRVDVPLGGIQPLQDEILLGGIAFAGTRGIRKVELSVDGGQTWRPAEVRRALSPYTWVIWTSDWRPRGPNTYPIQVRATDGAGEVQTSTVMGSLPSGATGYHRVTILLQEEGAQA